MILRDSPEWALARVGYVTASRFDAVMAKIKTGEAAERRNYRTEIITERLTGVPIDRYHNAAMQWGTDNQPAAVAAYEAETGVIVQPEAFIPHPSIPWVGATPDGLVGDDGLVEIKCPHVTFHHLSAWLDKAMPAEHRPQVQGQLFVTGRKWADFISFDPRLPERLRLLVVRVARDDAYIAELEKAVRSFLEEIEQWMSRIAAEQEKQEA